MVGGRGAVMNKLGCWSGRQSLASLHEYVAQARAGTADWCWSPARRAWASRRWSGAAAPGSAGGALVVGRVRWAVHSSAARAAVRHGRHSGVSSRIWSARAPTVTSCSGHCCGRSARPMWWMSLVIEDIHWADDATLDLLRFLGRRLQQRRYC